MYITGKFKLLILLIGSLALVACGSSSGGGASGGGGNLANGVFTKTVILNGTNDNWGYPFDSVFGPESRFQILYRASDINGSGMISSISFQRELANVTDILCPNITIRMGHTSLTDLTATFADNIEQGSGSFEIVLDNKTVTALVGAAGDYFDINLDVPFNYNGVENIVVEVIRPVVCNTDGLKLDTTIGLPSYVAVVNATTSGAATGTPNSYSPHIRFNYAGGDNEQTMGGTGSNLSPFGFSMPRMQSLYLASEINGSGPITGLAYQMDTISFAGSYTFSLKMGHTTLSTLGLTFADNYSDTPVTVATNVTVNIPAGIPAGGWVWITIPDGVFTYNGTDNLIVDIDKTVGTANNWVRTASIAGRRAEGNSGALIADAVDMTYYHMKFRFNGGTMDVIPAAVGGPDSFPFRSAADLVSQYLYLATELGTAGSITSLKCRTTSLLAYGDPAAQTGLNYTVTLSQTSSTVLDMSRTTNLVSPTVVYSGTFDQPAMKAGDWFGIDFTTPFAYNGSDNLVVEIAGNGGTDAVGVACDAASSSALYTGRRGWGIPVNDALNGTNNTPISIRFGITR